MEHGEPGFVPVPGQVQHMPVGFRSAHPADLIRVGDGHGQRVLRVIHGAVFLREGIRQIGHPRKGSLHGALEQFAVNIFPMAYFHGKNVHFTWQIDIGAGRKGQFFFPEVRTFDVHFSMCLLVIDDITLRFAGTVKVNRAARVPLFGFKSHQSVFLSHGLIFSVQQ